MSYLHRRLHKPCLIIFILTALAILQLASLCSGKANRHPYRRIQINNNSEKYHHLLKKNAQFDHHHHHHHRNDDQSTVVVVDTENGPVQGRRTSTMQVFKGIPFAQPPVGEYRWMAPQPASPWAPSVLDASGDFKPGCPQHCSLPIELCPLVTSEDCLYLNIFAPLNAAAGSNLPVMVFIAGGAFDEGAGSATLYNGEYYANVTQTLVVTFSYRLGALGFLVATTTRSDNGNNDQPLSILGNFGIQDQRAVLQWVKRNIAAFGGDPASVTLFGQSAGAASIGIHMMAAASYDDQPLLFHRAIMESNPWALPLKTIPEAAKYGAVFIEKLGCASSPVGDLLACMKNKTADEVLAAQEETSLIPDPFTFTLDIALTFDPIIDGDEIKMQPMEAFASGAYRRDIPLMMGSNANEGLMFVYGAWNHTLLEAEYVAAVLGIFRTHSPSVLKAYPPAGWSGLFKDSRPELSQLFTDYLFTCPARNVAYNMARNNNNNNNSAPVYLYNFNHVMSFDPWGTKYEYCVPKVCHGEELIYVFHSAEQNNFTFTPEEEQLSCTMVDYWASFAHTGDPNALRFCSDPLQPVTVWPQFGANDNSSSSSSSIDDDPYLVFELPTLSIRNSRTYNATALCDMWDSLGYQF